MNTPSTLLLKTIYGNLSFLLIFTFNLAQADVSHVIIFKDGSTKVTLIDSISADSIHYKDYDTNTFHRVSLNKVYFVYNDFQRIFYTSPSLHRRLTELEERGGYLVTHEEDTLHYHRIRFDRQMIRPMTYLYTKTDSLIPVEFLNVHFVRSDLSVMEKSVRKGFYSSLALFVSASFLEIISGWNAKTKNDPIFSMNSLLKFAAVAKDETLDLMPKITPFSIKKTGTQYSTMNLVVPISTMGWMVYDLYYDRRTHYIVPTDRMIQFPRSMGHLSLKIKIINQFNRIKSFITPNR